MFASTTIASTGREIRPTRHVGSGEDRRTIRVQTGRGTARRQAIAASLGYR